MMAREEKLALNAEQEAALGVMMSGANVFLTGEAGTGKSTLVREFLRRCRVPQALRLGMRGARSDRNRRAERRRNDDTQPDDA